VDPELVGLLNEARTDPEAVALVLFGSAASGSTHEESDLDVWYVRRSEPLPPRVRRGRLEIVPTTLALLRAAPDWLKPALAYAQTLWDETGEVEPVLAAARTISHDETAELYDGIRAPYPKEWQGKLGELEPLILEVARTGAPRLQQEICVLVHERAAKRGYSHVYEAWTGDIDRALSLDFA
jgi:Nucleotidyltransferase domain